MYLQLNLVLIDTLAQKYDRLCHMLKFILLFIDLLHMHKKGKHLLPPF